MNSVVENLLRTGIIDHSEIVIKLRPDEPLSDDRLFDFCQNFSIERIERTAEGEIIIMPPTGFETGDSNSELNMQLRVWA